MVNVLKKYPKDRIPPTGLYIKLIEITGLRNCWTVGEWIEYLQGGKNV